MCIRDRFWTYSQNYHNFFFPQTWSSWPTFPNFGDLGIPDPNPLNRNDKKNSSVRSFPGLNFQLRTWSDEINISNYTLCCLKYESKYDHMAQCLEFGQSKKYRTFFGPSAWDTSLWYFKEVLADKENDLVHRSHFSLIPSCSLFSCLFLWWIRANSFTQPCTLHMTPASLCSYT